MDSSPILRTLRVGRFGVSLLRNKPLINLMIGLSFPSSPCESRMYSPSWGKFRKQFGRQQY